MPNEAWIVLAVIGLTMLGIWRPRWLLVLVCAVVVLGSAVFFGIMLLIALSKFFGGSNSKK